MFKKVKVYKLEWKKNNTNNGGAQDEVILKHKSDQVVILSHTKKNGRMWTACKPEDLVRLVKTNKGIYEVLLKQQKKKIYFDVDAKSDTLEEVKALIVKQFPNARLQISGSVFENKHSYHIVISNYFLNNLEEFQRLKNWTLKQSEHLGIDTKVYTMNRNMKCINQSKANEKVKRVQEYVEGDKDISKHLITCYFDDDAKHALDLLPKIEEKEKKAKEYANIDLLDIPQMKLKKPDNVNIYKAKPEELLALIPNYKRDEKGALPHKFTWIIANYCYHNKVDFKTFWSWCQKKDNNKERQLKWYNSHWNGSIKNNTDIKINRNSIIKILTRFYPDIQLPQDLTNFKEAHNIKESKLINSNYLNKNDFTDKKYQLVKIGMGGNKTGATIDYLKELNNFCWITPRRSLAKDTNQRLKNEIKDIVHYQDVGKSAVEKIEKMKLQDKLIIQCESLHYLDHRTYNTVIIDEVESVLNTWNSYDTHRDNLNFNWVQFKQLLCKADKAILLDAFLSMKTINFINEIDNNPFYEIIDRVNKNNNNKKIIEIVNHKKKALIKWISQIIEDLKKGKRLYVFYPFKRGNKNYGSMVDLQKVLIEKSGLKKEEVSIYHGDVSDKKLNKLKKVNEEWENKKCIIANTCITVGVNYSNDNFDKLYMAWAPFVKTRDFIQASCRVRNLKDNKIVVVKLTGRIPKIVDYEKKEIDETYNNLLNDILEEERAKTYFSSFKYLSKIAGYKIEVNKLDNTINEKLIKEIENVDSNCYFKWENINDINQSQYENKLNKIWANDATLKDKLEVNKYKFVSLFTNKAPLDELKELWNNKKQDFFLKLRQDKPEWLKKSMKNMNIEYLQIPSKYKLEEETREAIFKEFSLHNVNKSCSNELLFSRALNTYFGGNYYRTTGKKKDVWKTTPEFNKMIVFGKNYFKLKTEIDFTINQFMDLDYGISRSNNNKDCTDKSIIE